MHRTTRFAVVLAVIGLLASCGDDDGSGAKFDVSPFVGTYEGTWTNETNGSTGPVTIAIDADENAGTASLTIDFGGNYLGLGDPPAAQLAGTISDSGAEVKGSSPLFGDYDVTIDAKGAIVGVMKNLGGGVIPELTYTGQVTSKTLDADYRVVMADGSEVRSLLRMTKAGA